MLALQKTHDGAGLELRDVPAPGPPGPDEILIEVAVTGICGSDLSIEKWGPSYRAFMGPRLPVTLGHETAGRVAAIGSAVERFAVGDRVVVNPAVACGACRACLAGDPVGCLDRQAVGMVRNGAFAGQFLAPADYAFHLPDDVSFELGALIEPLVVGAYSLDVAGFKPGDRVLVFGPGPIGQGTAALARAFGAREVAIVGFNDGPRLGVMGSLGFELLFDLAQEGAGACLAEAAGDGFDIAIDAAGAPGIVDQALTLLRPLGILAVASMGEKPETFDLLTLVKKRQQIRGVSRIPPSIWPKVIAAIAKEPASFEPLITHRLPLSQAAEALRLARSGTASKVLLVPDA